jgi:hypothetical protein
VDALKSAAKRRKLFSATVKKETKHILAPETQYRPDSPPLESRSQVLAPETQDGPDSPPLESQSVLGKCKQYVAKKCKIKEPSVS